MKPSRRQLLSLTLALLPTIASAQTFAFVQTRPALENALLPDSPILGEAPWTLAGRLKHYKMPSVSIAIVTDGRLTHALAIGLADPKTGRRANNETLYDAGSVSKAVTALMVLRLVDSGKLSLDSPVNDFLKTWKLPENEFTRETPITLRKLLSHTAGISVSGFWGYLENQPLPTLPQILDGIPPASNGPVRVVQKHGDWRYSGGGFVIVQQLLEDVTGKSFADAADELVFAPLKMTRSTFVQGLPSGLRGNVAVPTSEASYFSGKRLHPHAAAAGLYSTSTDLAEIIVAMMASLRNQPGAFLKPETARLILDPIVTDREPWDRSFTNRRNTQKDQAIGFMKIGRGGKGQRMFVYHDGINAGFRSRLILDPVSGDGAVILVNSDGDEEFLLETTRAAALSGGWNDWIPEPIRPTKLSAKELDAFVGRYRRGDDSVVSITRDGDRLRWVDLYTAPQPIYPVGNDHFEHRELFGRASEFQRDAAGKIVSLDGWKRMAGTEPNLPSEWFLHGETARGKDSLRARLRATNGKIDEGKLAEMAFNLMETHGNPGAAAAVLSVGLEFSPGSAGAWDALGDALKRSGDIAGGVRAEARGAILREFREMLTAEFEKGPTDGLRAFRRLREKHGEIPLGDLLERLGKRFDESGKPEQAAALAALAGRDSLRRQPTSPADGVVAVLTRK